MKIQTEESKVQISTQKCQSVQCSVCVCVMIEISICPNAGSERPKVREEQRRNSIKHGHHHYSTTAIQCRPTSQLKDIKGYNIVFPVSSMTVRK